MFSIFCFERLDFLSKKSYQNVKGIKNRQVMNKKIFRSSLSEKVGLFNVMMTIYELILVDDVVMM
jgi:hypothetical protein